MLCWGKRIKSVCCVFLIEQHYNEELTLETPVQKINISERKEAFKKSVITGRFTTADELEKGMQNIKKYYFYIDF